MHFNTLTQTQFFSFILLFPEAHIFIHVLEYQCKDLSLLAFLK